MCVCMCVCCACPPTHTQPTTKIPPTNPHAVNLGDERQLLPARAVREVEVIPIGADHQQPDMAPVQDERVGAAPGHRVGRGGRAGVEGLVEHLKVVIVWVLAFCDVCVCVCVCVFLRRGCFRV